ncbi:hypothetical protein ABEF93_002617 [Exophiala dermatitidis]
MSNAPLLPSFRRQLLVLDFSALRDSCPAGIYLSLTPGKPWLWAGVLFVHKGPYAGAVLRFQITFPDTYPDLPPLVTLSSDIFHPLVVPLTTYTFSASTGDASSTLSASDTDRLPPGAFSLRHGFPAWFRWTDTNVKANDGLDQTEQDHDATPPGGRSAAGMKSTFTNATSQHLGKDRKHLILDVLHHFQDAFQDEKFLDTIPLDAAGDPSAWHAWRAHRGLAKNDARPNISDVETGAGASPSPKHPGDWKWDGVWESRVHNGIQASVSEGALFGGGGAANVSADMRNLDPHQKMLLAADRQIRFSKLDEEHLEAVRAAIKIYDTPNQP